MENSSGAKHTVTTYKRAEDIHFAEVDDEFYLTLENKNVVVCLNTTAFMFLENLDGFSRAQDIADAYSQKFNLNPEEIRSSVEEMCRRLLDLGVLVSLEHKEKEIALKKGPFSFNSLFKEAHRPEIFRIWQGAELEGGLFVNSEGCDIHVIVPNTTDGPIKTCPPHTCTVPAGLFTYRTIIRTFNQEWQRNFENFRREGFVHFKAR